MTSTQYHAHAWCRSFNAWADGVGGFCLFHKFCHIMTMDGGASTSTLFCLISVGNHSELHVFFFSQVSYIIFFGVYTKYLCCLDNNDTLNKKL